MRGAAAGVRPVRPARTWRRRATGPRPSTTSSPRKRGGSRTSRCSARCTPSTPRSPGGSGTRACARTGVESIKAAREALAGDVRFNHYLQWQADLQWRRARAEAEVAVFGDLPFMVASDSADVWARQHAFRFDATIGVPPDAFSETGPGLGPAGLSLGRDRGGRLRVDPAARAAQRRPVPRLPDRPPRRALPHLRDSHGRQRALVLAAGPAVAAQAGRDAAAAVRRDRRARASAEDLGTVPDFVRASIARLRIPGYKVLRWEREWDAPGQPFRDPASLPVGLGGDDGDARHRDRWPSGGRRRPWRSACLRADSRAGRARARRRGRDVRRGRAARACSNCCTRRARTWSSCRCRTSSAGAIASTRRRPWRHENWIVAAAVAGGRVAVPRRVDRARADDLRGLAAHHGRLRLAATSTPWAGTTRYTRH